MAIKQSQWATFNKSAHRSIDAGDVVCTDFYYDIASTAANGLLAADIVDLGVLPANTRIVDAQLFVEGSAVAANATVGILVGTPGQLLQDDGVSARTLGTEIYNAVALSNSTIARLTQAGAIAIAASNVDRSIGLQISADAAAGASKIHVVLAYRS